MKKVIFLAYYYPPAGGAGVQRTVKFVKYLNPSRFTPIVVSGTGSETNGNMPKDDTLAEEVKSVKNYPIKFNRFEKLLDKLFSGRVGRLLNAEMLAWKIAARRTLLKTVKHENPDLIFVTASPFKACSVARAIAQKTNTKWIADLRDPWALDPIRSYSTWLHYKLELSKMKNTCRKANAIIMNTPASQNKLLAEFDFLATDKVFCITNGWDKSDFDIEAELQNIDLPENCLKIVHTGVFHTHAAQRNTIFNKLRYRPVKCDLITRTPYYLFKAVNSLIESGRLKPGEIRFIFAGNCTDADKNLAKQFNVESMVNYTGYITHAQSIALLKKADALFLPMHDTHNQKPLIVPGKTYEYLAAAKPILACLPDGDARRIIQNSNLGITCPPQDVSAIANAIIQLVETKRTSAAAIKNQALIDSFQRSKLSTDLQNVFDNVINDVKVPKARQNDFNLDITKQRKVIVTPDKILS